MSDYDASTDAFIKSEDTKKDPTQGKRELDALNALRAEVVELKKQVEEQSEIRKQKQDKEGADAPDESAWFTF